MTLSIIVIGDEILLGQVTDTNSGEIARTLGPMGWSVKQTIVVGDDADDIRQAVNKALAQSQLVITTGGLGPTKDDITKRVLADTFGGEMVEDKDVLANVKRVFEKRGLQLNELTRTQAMVPSSCQVIQNKLGTAPIMLFERDGKVLISMPGVPFEMTGMLHSAVVGEIAKRFMADNKYTHHTLMVTGITESALAERLNDYENGLPPQMHLAYLPTPGYIRLRLDGVYDCNDEAMDRKFEEATARLKSNVADLLLHDGDASVAEILLMRLREKGYTVATAESCTGGNIAHRITSVAGSSDCFMGSVVSYANSVKAAVLGVKEDNLRLYGAVSEEVVKQMAQGVARLMGTDCAVATSGIAGPGGGTAEKPVGTVWIAALTPGGLRTKLLRLPGNRDRVIDRATTEAMLMLIV